MKIIFISLKILAGVAILFFLNHPRKHPGHVPVASGQSETLPSAQKDQKIKTGLPVSTVPFNLAEIEKVRHMQERVTLADIKAMR